MRAVQVGRPLIVPLLLGMLALAPSAAASSDPSAAAWQHLSAGATTTDAAAQPAVQPDRFEALSLDRSAIEDVLAAAPEPQASAAAAPLTISLPTPEGDFQRFAIRRSSVMEPGLAAQHPEISTFSGTGIDEPGSTVHLDLGSLGLHSSVIGPGGSWYIDPYFRGKQSVYVSYFGRDLTKNPHGTFVERDAGNPDPFGELDVAPTAEPATVQRRTYRLALISDPSYAQYFGAANVTSAKVTLMNRVNQIYEADFGVHISLIANNDLLNLNTAALMTGPNGPCGSAPCYTSQQAAFCSGGTLTRNETVIGQIIGAGNYDIGHIAFGLSGGGIAALGVVGRAAKAQGCTGVPTPEGDLFAVDYVAHEMGHQFDGNHTMNGIRFFCGFGNRNGPTSVEPGSGSTVMAYAGICGRDDLQPHSDPYFSQRSITEIGTYISRHFPDANEVQNVALRNFNADGDSFTLTFEGATSDPLVRGTNYDAASIEAEIESITGADVLIDGFGGSGAPDDTGFQVTFAGALADTDVASLSVTNPVGMSGFVGEKVQGGPVANRGNTIVDTGNHIPVVSTRSKYRIPVRTPFRLTGSATDADSDPITYLWEQNDVGGVNGTSLISNVKRDGPLFRQFGTAALVSGDDTLESPSPGENAAGTDPTRVFPDIAQIVAGNTNAATGTCPTAPLTLAVVDCFSEFLPTGDWVGVPQDRTLHFRLTARDGNPVAGGVSHSDTELKLIRGAGPFRVTSQAARQTVAGGTQLAVRWDVANTDVDPIEVRRVAIRLSLNDGETFPLLLRSTPNDGLARVTLPNTTAERARIKVEALGNVFFDVTRGALTIEPDLDNDGDGISNPDDGCPAVPGAGPIGCPTASRTVTLEYSASLDRFRGRLESSEPDCVDSKRVSLYRDGTQIDSRLTTSTGGYAFTDPSPAPGSYEALAPNKIVDGALLCERASSAPVAIP